MLFAKKLLYYQNQFPKLYTTPGTYSTVLPAGKYEIVVRGGGGCGGNDGAKVHQNVQPGSGGAGASGDIQTTTITLGHSVLLNVVVGAGGTTGSLGGNGGASVANDNGGKGGAGGGGGHASYISYIGEGPSVSSIVVAKDLMTLASNVTCIRYPSRDTIMNGVQYYAWFSNTIQSDLYCMFTITETPSDGDTVYDLSGDPWSTVVSVSHEQFMSLIAQGGAGGGGGGAGGHLGRYADGGGGGAGGGCYITTVADGVFTETSYTGRSSTVHHNNTNGYAGVDGYSAISSTIRSGAGSHGSNYGMHGGAAASYAGASGGSGADGGNDVDAWSGGGGGGAGGSDYAGGGGGGKTKSSNINAENASNHFTTPVDTTTENQTYGVDGNYGTGGANNNVGVDGFVFVVRIPYTPV